MTEEREARPSAPVTIYRQSAMAGCGEADRHGL